MNKLYLDDIKRTVEPFVAIEALKDKAFFITGANGLIGSFLVDMLMYLNKNHNLNITVVVNSRSETKVKERFSEYISSPLFKYYIGDINNKIDYDGNVDYIVNCASNTHPLQYVTDPIGTIMTNINGTANVLDFALKSNSKKMVFLSSVEIYGENIYGVRKFKENDMGYINCNTLRAGYNEAKRCGEALCQAYIEKYGVDVSIVRLPRVYGPTVKADDTKALSQFINNAIAGENIVLKSSGEQYFSYLYVADAVLGILRCLVVGRKGDVYNLGNVESDIKLKDLAKMVAKVVGTEVIFDLPDEKEAKGFSKANIARLDYSKAEMELGYKPKYSMEEGIKNTIEILKSRVQSITS